MRLPRFVVLLCVVVWSSVGVRAASAREVQQGDQCVVATDQTVQGDLFVLCTDGISSLDRASMPARAARRDASGLAMDLVSEFGRPHDDASCLVARWCP